MNNKKCKQLRKQSNIIAKNHEGMQDTVYREVAIKVKVMKMDTKGNLVPSVETRITKVLDSCQRLIYKSLKKTYSKGVPV